MVKHDNRIRVRVEYVVLRGSESYYNYPMFWSDREESFLFFPRTPDWSGLAVNVYIRCKHRYRGEVESVIRIMEEYLNVSVLNVYYPQEGFSDGKGDVANQYPSKVEKYERPDAAALDCLRRPGGYFISDRAAENNDLLMDNETYHHPFAGMPVP